MASEKVRKEIDKLLAVWPRVLGPVTEARERSLSTDDL